MLTIDMHLDLSMNALQYNRDLKLSVPEIRQLEADMQGKSRGNNTVAFPELRRGDVAISSATLLARSNPTGKSNLDFRSPEIAFAMARGQLAYYQQLAEDGHVRFLNDWPAIEQHLREWETRGRDQTPLGFILSMEGADPIMGPAQLPRWWDDGLRILSLVHYGVGRYANGTGVTGPLTQLGRDMLSAMAEVGMILDLTHLCDESFWEAARLFKGDVLATHNNCRALVPGDRQFTDDQIRFIVERDGVIGAAFDNWMLHPGYVRGQTPRELIAMTNVVDHIDHVCQVAGNVRHAALGTDLDGGFGTEQSPRDLDTIADLQTIPAMLRDRGYAESDVEAIMSGNWLRLFKRAWQG